MGKIIDFNQKKAEDVWEDIKKDVLNTKIFYIKMEIPGATYSESFTFEKIWLNKKAL